MRALRLATLFAVPPAVVLALILGLAVGWIAGLVALVVVGGALFAWVRMAGDRLVNRRLSGPGVRPADPSAEARLFNLVEGLSASAGVTAPRLFVFEADGLNAMVAGTDTRRASMAVTSGLLSELDRVELEAVVAAQLWLMRHGEIVPATALAATFGVGRRLMLRADRDTRIDQGAVALTKYPPALASALEKIETKGAVVPGQPGWMTQLWLADPRESGPSGHAAVGRLPLTERVEALREL